MQREGPSYTVDEVSSLNFQRVVAGAFVGAGALLLIHKGELALGATLLSGMLAFFVGEKNGERKATKDKT